MKTIDCSNLACPQPVISTKKAIEAGLPIKAIVDNHIAKENVLKLCNKLGVKTKVEAKDNKFEIVIFSSGSEVAIVEEKNNEVDGVFLITSKVMGKGDDKLGEALMKAFVYTLSQKDKAPAKVMLLNSGVFLAGEGSQVSEQLLELEQKGTEIISCGTCLDFYNLKDKLAVGTIASMYDIVENLSLDKVVTL